MHRIFLAGAVGLAIAATPAPASAQLAAGYNDRQTYDFDASDAAFEARVRLAARQWCGERIGRVTLREYLQTRACKRDFIERVHAGENPAIDAA